MVGQAAESDETENFLAYAQRIVNNAQFVVDALPNADGGSIERSLRMLQLVKDALQDLDDPWIEESDIEAMLASISRVETPLEEFQSMPSPQHNTGTSTYQTNSPGRPSYVLDLDRAVELHDLGNSWKAVADALGVSRSTLYAHLDRNQLSSSRPMHTEISDDDLDKAVNDLSLKHPLAGSSIMAGHLLSLGIRVSRARIQASLRRVDEIGVFMRWSTAIKRRVYRVRGANALWHMDGNEKLKPWGFYIHGCVDGHSRLIIYLFCSNNKRARTVRYVFMKYGVLIYGWPSRTRADFGTENNEVERLMIEHWGEDHHPYLRGRSVHNVRIERLWRDVRKDTLEVFRRVFMHMEETGMLDMENPVHRVCLYVVYQPRIQASLDRTLHSWNRHPLRTEHHKSPQAIYELSKTKAIRLGYWNSDPGDSVLDASDPLYGLDPQAGLPPQDEISEDPLQRASEGTADIQGERDTGLLLNDDEEIEVMREILQGVDLERDDGNWGIGVFQDALRTAEASLQDFTEL